MGFHIKNKSAVRIPLIGFGPVIDHPFPFFAVIADLDRNVGMRMVIVLIAAFVFLMKFDKNLFVHPGLNGYIGVRFSIALKNGVFLLILIDRRLLIILKKKTDDLLGPVFHPLHIKIDLSPNLMFGRSIFFGRVCVRVMNGTAMTTSHNDPLACLFLKKIQQIKKDGIDIFFARNNRKTVPRSRAIRNRLLRISGIKDWRVERAPLAAKKLLSDAREVRFRFPRIQIARCVKWCLDGCKEVIVTAIDRFRFTITETDLFLL